MTPALLSLTASGTPVTVAASSGGRDSKPTAQTPRARHNPPRARLAHEHREVTAMPIDVLAVVALLVLVAIALAWDHFARVGRRIDADVDAILDRPRDNDRSDAS